MVELLKTKPDKQFLKSLKDGHTCDAVDFYEWCPICKAIVPKTSVGYVEKIRLGKCILCKFICSVEDLKSKNLEIRYGTCQITAGQANQKVA